MKTDSLVVYEKLLADISKIYEDARDSTLISINKIRNQACWMIGQRIVEVEQDGAVRAEHGKRLLENLSVDLTTQYRSGFSQSNLRTMRKFYLLHPNQHPGAELSWSHHKLLLTVQNDAKRAEYQEQAIKNSWSKRQLKRVIDAEDAEFVPERDPKKPKNRIAKVDEVFSGELDVERGRYLAYQVKDLSVHPKKGPQLVVDCGFAQYLEMDFEGLEDAQDGDIFFVAQTRRGFEFKKMEIERDELFTCRAYIERIVDGDTVLAKIDCGFGLWTRQRLRLRGIDTPPLETPAGTEAKEYLEELLRPVEFIVVKTYASDKYDRYITDIFYLPGERDPQVVAQRGKHLNQELLDQELAVPFK